MMRPGEALVFVSLAAGLHVGVWSITGPLRGAGGEGGAQSAPVALTLAAPEHSALIRDWQAPPDLAADTPVPAAPPPEALPPEQPAHERAGPRLDPVTGLTPVGPASAPPGRPDLAPNAAPAPTPPALTPPQADRRADPDRLRTAETPRAEMRRPDIARPDAPPRAERTTPAPPPKTAGPAKSPATAPPRAASAGGAKAGQTAPVTGTGHAPSVSAAARDRAQAEWGARIQRKVHRRLIYPRGATGGGTARVALSVDRAGRLTALRLVRSSGMAAFDRAALNAVRRAGRFPPAPDSLTRASYTFSLSLAFRP
ncbi:MAG: TonB family protein [Jhaorihella sp.]